MIKRIRRMKMTGMRRIEWSRRNEASEILVGGIITASEFGHLGGLNACRVHGIVRGTGVLSRKTYQIRATNRWDSERSITCSDLLYVQQVYKAMMYFGVTRNVHYKPVTPLIWD